MWLDKLYDCKLVELVVVRIGVMQVTGDHAGSGRQRKRPAAYADTVSDVSDDDEAEPCLAARVRPSGCVLASLLSLGTSPGACEFSWS
jgi:hypothetical protein